MAGVRHKKQLFGGRSAEEVHSKYAFPRNAKCQVCSYRPLIRGIVMMELQEARKNPFVEQLATAAPEAFLQNVVQLKGSDGTPRPYYRVSVVYACKEHKRELEKALAKAPSHCVVEINYGPGPDRLTL